MGTQFELSVTHLDGLRLRADSGPHSFEMDYPLTPGDPGHAPTPLQVLAAALAGCACNSMVALLGKSKQPLKGLTVQVRAQRAELHPTVLTHIHLTFNISGPVDPAAAARALDQSEGMICPAWAMLKPGVEISSELKMLG